MEVCKYTKEINEEQLFDKFVKNVSLSKELGQFPVINNLEDLCNELENVFKYSSVDVDYVMHLMKSYKSNPADWKKYAKFDRFRYTRNLVHSGNGNYNLMALCWGEGHGSAIHDHANAHCFMKMLQGELQEIRFAWPEEDGKPMKEISRKTLEMNGVCYMSDSLGLHRVENSSHTEPAVSLHLYCPPFNSCNVFNQQTGQKSSCNVTFWSKYGERRNKIVQETREPEDN